MAANGSPMGPSGWPDPPRESHGALLRGWAVIKQMESRSISGANGSAVARSVPASPGGGQFCLPSDNGPMPSLGEGCSAELRCQVDQLCVSFPRPLPPQGFRTKNPLQIPGQRSPREKHPTDLGAKVSSSSSSVLSLVGRGVCKRKPFETVCRQSTTGGLLSMKARLRGR